MANQLLPFRRFSRQRQNRLVTGASFSGLGGTVTTQCNRVGLLNYLVLTLRGTVTLSSGGAFADLGPWSLIDRVRVDLNLGNMNIVDISGYELYQLNKLMARGWSPDGGGDYTPSTLNYSAPVASGANSWVLTLLVPISANPGSEYDSGMINLQAPEVQLNVTVRLAAAGSDFVTNFSSIGSFVLDIDQCYFDIPDPRQVALPPGEVVRTVQRSVPFAATGVVDYTLERQGTLLQLVSTLRCNGSRSNAVDQVELIANINDTIYSHTARYNKFLYEMNYSKPSDTGVFVLDLWHARESASSGDDRDVIDTTLLTTLQWNPTVTAGTTLGSGNNFWNTARRVLVKFAVPGLGPSL